MPETIIERIRRVADLYRTNPEELKEGAEDIRMTEQKLTPRRLLRRFDI